MKTVTYTALSKIHGTGLFASKDLLPYMNIIKFEGYDSTKWTPYLIATDERWFEVTTDAKYANHSETPNATVVDNMLIATEKIPAGTEITFDYGW